MELFIITMYIISLSVLFIFSSHGFVMVYHYLKLKNKKEIAPTLDEKNLPIVTIQLPLFNEKYVVRRLIDACCKIDYPKNKLEIQVLDDSTDDTVALVASIVSEMKEAGNNILHIRRTNRKGFKAGALKEGLEVAKGEFIAVFDADFVPKKDFLKNTLSYFENKKIGMVQSRWEHLNENYSFLTKIQALALDGHFVIEQAYRNKAGYFINFNGTGGIWRKSCIIDAGNWQSDTLTEDLDLSYRAQLKGWKFKFLTNVTSPAELPADINALKSQQFRWTKGAIETSRKLLPKVWKSKMSLKLKIHSTFHLTNNFAFPFIILAGFFNVPLVFIKHAGGYENYFDFMSLFIFAFIGSFLFYMFSQKAIYKDWQDRMKLFPLFMAGSMGFSINNTKAVLEGLFKKKSEFVRTPKYSIKEKNDSWKDKQYVPVKLSWIVWVEFSLAIYCLIGLTASIIYLEITAIPFQFLYFFGYASVSYLSFQQAFEARRVKLNNLEASFATN